MSCAGASIVINNKIPIEGTFEPGFTSRLTLNMRLLKKLPPRVGMFVFAHECAHGIVGGDELAADCYAVKQGVKEDWFDETLLKPICDSFHNAPETDTHPSGRARCRNVNRCFARAKKEKENVAATRN